MAPGETKSHFGLLAGLSWQFRAETDLFDFNMIVRSIALLLLV